ncbi:MAG: hypothetical protein ABWW69_06155 [Pyrodictiaceae archaeon]
MTDLRGLACSEAYLFLVYTRGACPPPANPLSLASQGKRLDVAARIIAAAYGTGVLRPPEAVFIYVDDWPKRTCMVRITREDLNLEGANVYEIHAATILIRLLRSGRERVVHDIGFRDAVNVIAESYKAAPVVLAENGKDITMFLREKPKRVLYILGGAVDPPRDSIRGLPAYSIGPRSYLASHVVAFIVLLHNIKYLEEQILDAHDRDDG